MPAIDVDVHRVEPARTASTSTSTCATWSWRHRARSSPATTSPCASRWVDRADLEQLSPAIDPSTRRLVHRGLDLAPRPVGVSRSADVARGRRRKPCRSPRRRCSIDRSDGVAELLGRPGAGRRGRCAGGRRSPGGWPGRSASRPARAAPPAGRRRLAGASASSSSSIAVELVVGARRPPRPARGELAALGAAGRSSMRRDGGRAGRLGALGPGPVLEVVGVLPCGGRREDPHPEEDEGEAPRPRPGPRATDQPFGPSRRRRHRISVAPGRAPPPTGLAGALADPSWPICLAPGHARTRECADDRRPGRRPRGPGPRAGEHRPRRAGRPPRRGPDHALLRLRPDRRQPARRQPHRPARAAPLPGRRPPADRPGRRRHRHGRRSRAAVRGAQPARRRDAVGQRRGHQGPDRPDRRPVDGAAAAGSWSTTGTGPATCACSTSSATSASTSPSTRCWPGSR